MRLSPHPNEALPAPKCNTCSLVKPASRFPHVTCVFCYSSVTYAWEGGKVLASEPQFEKLAVTRAEYNENGPGMLMDSKHEVS